MASLHDKLMAKQSTKKLAKDIHDVGDDMPILQGYLKKEGTTRGSWKRRWFILRRLSLQYLKRPDSVKSQGSISVDVIQRIQRNSAEYPEPHSFQLVTPKRTYALQAPAEGACDHWLRAIAATMMHLQQKGAAAAAAASAPAPALAPAPAPAPPAVPAASATPTKPAQRSAGGSASEPSSAVSNGSSKKGVSFDLGANEERVFGKDAPARSVSFSSSSPPRNGSGPPPAASNGTGSKAAAAAAAAPDDDAGDEARAQPWEPSLEFDGDSTGELLAGSPPMTPDLESLAYSSMDASRASAGVGAPAPAPRPPAPAPAPASPYAPPSPAPAPAPAPTPTPARPSSRPSIRPPSTSPKKRAGAAAAASASSGPIEVTGLSKGSTTSLLAQWPSSSLEVPLDSGLDTSNDMSALSLLNSSSDAAPSPAASTRRSKNDAHGARPAISSSRSHSRSHSRGRGRGTNGTKHAGAAPRKPWGAPMQPQDESVGPAPPPRSRSSAATSKVAAAFRGGKAGKGGRGAPTPSPPSANRLLHAVSWVNGLHLAPPVAPGSLAPAFKTGLLLCALLERTATPTPSFQGLDRKPLARRRAVANIEKGLAVLWKRRFDRLAIPSPDDLWDENEARVSTLVTASFEAFALRTARTKAAPTLMWATRVLRKYGVELSSVFVPPPPAAGSPPVERPSWRGLYAEVGATGGVPLALMLHYFAGPAAVDLSLLYRQPASEQQRLSNATVVASMIDAAHVGVVFDPRELATGPTDDDVMLLQCSNVCTAFKGLASALPAVHSDADAAAIAGAHIRRGAHDEDTVVGATFRDPAMPVSAVPSSRMLGNPYSIMDPGASGRHSAGRSTSPTPRSRSAAGGARRGAGVRSKPSQTPRPGHKSAGGGGGGGGGGGDGGKSGTGSGGNGGSSGARADTGTSRTRSPTRRLRKVSSSGYGQGPSRSPSRTRRRNSKSPGRRKASGGGAAATVAAVAAVAAAAGSNGVASPRPGVHDATADWDAHQRRESVDLDALQGWGGGSPSSVLGSSDGASRHGGGVATAAGVGVEPVAADAVLKAMNHEQARVYHAVDDVISSCGVDAATADAVARVWALERAVLKVERTFNVQLRDPVTATELSPAVLVALAEAAKQNQEDRQHRRTPKARQEAYEPEAAPQPQVAVLPASHPRLHSPHQDVNHQPPPRRRLAAPEADAWPAKAPVAATTPADAFAVTPTSTTPASSPAPVPAPVPGPASTPVPRQDPPRPYTSSNDESPFRPQPLQPAEAPAAGSAHAGAPAAAAVVPPTPPVSSVAPRAMLLKMRAVWKPVVVEVKDDGMMSWRLPSAPSSARPEGYLFLGYAASVKVASGTLNIRIARQHVREAARTCGGLLQLELQDKPSGHPMPFVEYGVMLQGVHAKVAPK